VALEGERVLLLARDPVAVGEDLRPLAERHGPLVRHRGVDHPPAERRRVQGLAGSRERLLRLEQHPRRAAHRLDATRKADRGVAGGDRAAGAERRLHAGAAQPVDGGAGSRRRQAGQQDRHAGHVAVVLARLVGVAEVHVLDRPGAGIALDQRAHHVRGEVVRAHVRERAAVLAGRRADGVDDVRVAHAA
jgi:hypothetical protein